MNLLALSLLLPSLFWTQGPESAPELARYGVKHIAVPPAQWNAWKAQSAIQASSVDPSALQKLPAPGVSFRSNVASATREPWVDSDGWHYLRQPDGRFFYDVAGPNAALAAAEAFTFGGQAFIQTDQAGLPALARMLDFLAALPQASLQPVADIDFVDDGSPLSAECLNLLVRRNLLVQAAHSIASQPRLLQVVLGSPNYPKKDAANPVVFAQQVRQRLTDDKRSLRVYGSNVVIGRLATNGAKTRLFLLNYGSGKYSIEGIRVRVLGHYSKARLFDPERSSGKPLDTLFTPVAAELTLSSLQSFAVVDLED